MGDVSRKGDTRHKKMRMNPHHTVSVSELLTVGFFPALAVAVCSSVIRQSQIQRTRCQFRTVKVIRRQCFQILCDMLRSDPPCLVRTFSLCQTDNGIGARGCVYAAVDIKANPADTIFLNTEKNLYGVAAVPCSFPIPVRMRDSFPMIRAKGCLQKTEGILVFRFQIFFFVHFA